MEETVKIINKLIKLLEETPRSEINDAGLTQAEQVLADYRDTLLNPSSSEIYCFPPFSELKEGDYVEGIEAYGFDYQIMRGWVSKIYPEYVEIRCDDWYEGRRGSNLYPSVVYGIKKLEYKEYDPDEFSNWWAGKLLRIRSIGDRSHED